ncbi:MAG: 6-carboxytetrahydropterin synthase QueD [Candidatus Omnitrophota bacterium]|nr:6-carboxytetrahydropterin synthase QueD [Candidatus Omnitrophota bacterium]
MFTIKVRSTFSSAHNLRGYKGKCEDVHGHNWRVEAAVSSGQLDEIGMVVDFKELKEALNRCISGLDHRNLNDLEYFKNVNPTSENIARFVYEKLVAEFPGVDVKEVTVWETDTSSATYSGGI